MVIGKLRNEYESFVSLCSTPVTPIILMVRRYLKPVISTHGKTLLYPETIVVIVMELETNVDEQIAETVYNVTLDKMIERRREVKGTDPSFNDVEWEQHGYEEVPLNELFAYVWEDKFEGRVWCMGGGRYEVYGFIPIEKMYRYIDSGYDERGNYSLGEAIEFDAEIFINVSYDVLTDKISGFVGLDIPEWSTQYSDEPYKEFSIEDPDSYFDGEYEVVSNQSESDSDSSERSEVIKNDS